MIHHFFHLLEGLGLACVVLGIILDQVIQVIYRHTFGCKSRKDPRN